MHRGWVSIHRKIKDSPLWLAEPFTKGQAWIDLIMMANHKDGQVFLGNELVTIKRGQLHTSEGNLAKRWRWSRKKVRAFLDTLKGIESVTTNSTTKGTTITIENYSFYQDRGTAKDTAEDTAKDTAEGTSKEHQKNIKRTSKGTQTIISNNVNNNNNVFIEDAPKPRKPRFQKPNVEEVTLYCRERNNNVNPKNFIDFYESKGWMVGKNQMKDWKAAVRTWETRENEEQKRREDLPNGWPQPPVLNRQVSRKLGTSNTH